MTTTTQPPIDRIEFDITIGVQQDDSGRWVDTRKIQVLGEATANPALGIAPLLDRREQLTGLFSLTHIPTGLAVVQRAHPRDLRAMAALLADLPWADVHTTDEVKAHPTLTPDAIRILKAHRAGAEDDTDERPRANSWSADDDGGIPRATRELTVWNLANFQDSWDRMYGSDPEKRVELAIPGTVTEEKPHGESNPWWHFHLIRSVDSFAISYLLLMIQRLDPEQANLASAWLADQWDGGDSLGEWCWHWAQDLAAGKDVAELDVPGAPAPFGDLFGSADGAA
jgi:hypothetical protein